MKKTKKHRPKESSAKQTLFQSVSCPVCGKDSFTVMREGTFPDNLSESFLKTVYRSSSDAVLFEQVVRCNKCQTVYLNPRLKPELIVDAYAEGEDEAHVAQDAMRVRTFEKALKRLAQKYNIKLSPSTKVLDIGCAGGAFLLAAENLGISTIGIEPNKWMSKFAQTEYGLDVRPGTLSDYHFDDNSFDLVTLWDVIEHVPEPTVELKEINRILKPGGLLVVNYPDYSSFPARALGKKWPFWLSVHLTYYTPKTIRKHLAKTGFKTEEIAPHWQTLELGYVLKRITPYFSLAAVPKKIAESIGLAMMPMTYWVGQTEVIARKKVKISSKPKAIIFDMDGVLFLSGESHEKAFIETLNEVGIKKFNYAQITGMRAKEGMRKVFSDNDRELSDEELERLVNIKQSRGWKYLRSDGKVADHSDNLLANLSQRYHLALASSASEKTVQIYLDKAENPNIFKVCLNGSSVTEAKPSPEIYLLAAEKLGLKPSECIVIEDAVNGIKAGVSAGMKVIAVEGTDVAENLREAGASQVAKHLREVEELLLKGEQ